MTLSARFLPPLKGVCLLVLVLLVACTSTTVKIESLEERAQSRWDALLSSDFATAYAYSTPGYRSSLSVVDFEIGFRTRKVFYTSAKYLDHSCESDTCTVRMTIGYSVVGALRGVAEWKSKTAVEEKWVRVDGQWWFFQKR
jgi:hypothetical protein